MNNNKWDNERERERKVILYQIRSHGEYVHMEYTYTWSIRTHGVYVHMEYTYTWRIHTHGDNINMEKFTN